VASTLTPSRGRAQKPTKTQPPAGNERASIPRSATAEQVCALLGTDLTGGLGTADATNRLEQIGPNRLVEPVGRSRWRRFADQFRNLLVGILAGAALLAALLGDLKDAVVVAVVLVINAVLGYVQEGRAESAMAALKRMLATRSRVRRDGAVIEVPADELVPGDVVLLEAGDRIPADGRFVETVGVEVDESSLTGESVPVAKTNSPLPDNESSAIGDRLNEGFMNTTVVRGRATLVVTATGMGTEMGRIAALIEAAPEQSTPLQVQLDRLGRRLAALAGAAVALVFAVRLAQGEPLADAVLGAVALAVAAIPEGLPAVVTVTLAVGVHQMALRKAIVKRLASVETLGSTTVICSDKTGTLTQNRMAVRTVRTTTNPEGLDASDHGRSVDVLAAAVLCSDATLSPDGHVVGEPTEGALVLAAHETGVDVDTHRTMVPRIAEVPFDSDRKYMATIHSDGNGVLIVAKGAPDVLLARCTTDPGGAVLDETNRHAWAGCNEALGAQGQRVLAVATRRLPADLADDTALADPDGLVEGLQFIGLVGLVDPPRPEARTAIGLCHDAGIQVKMITGDHPATAAAIAAELGIVGDTLSGADLDALTDPALDELVDHTGVFARVSPEHKVRIVGALKRRGHIVAMTGDGVNDAAALRHADIGVAMGITGTEVTKDAADMVLADDNFATIVGAVEQGRAIYDNIVTFVRFQVTTNLGAIGTLLGASVLGLPAPLTAIQVLFVNLIADGPPAMTLGVDPPKPGTMHRPPLPPGTPILDRPRIQRLLAAAVVMTAGTLAVLVAARHLWTDEVALTMAFTTFVFFQLVNVANARTETESVFTRASLTNNKLWAAIGAVAAIQVATVSIPALQGIFDTTALNAAQWAICIGAAFTVLATEEARKALLRRRTRPASADPSDPRRLHGAAR
jgi:Ca2+-transporting ATPase